MNLSWPPGVPFSYNNPLTVPSENVTDHQLGDESRSISSVKHGVSQEFDKSTNSQSILSIYERQIAADEIRLLCLAAADDPKRPIVGCVETYSRDSCPEYEVTSYTWGREGGSDSKNSPIYLGPYWDVWLQTRNCLAVLHYFRPRREFRMAWVDAICINQDDTSERISQVTSMGLTYKTCARVVVYLGSDIVHRPSTHYRARGELHTLDIQILHSHSQQ